MCDAAAGVVMMKMVNFRNFFLHNCPWSMRLGTTTVKTHTTHHRSSEERKLLYRENGESVI